MRERRKLLSVRRYAAGFEVRTEEVDWGGSGLRKPLVMRTAFTPKGEYIGPPARARALIVKRGIAPQLADAKHEVCSVGFCERERKWYGWSHRAICGFGLGDMLFEEGFGDDRTPFVKHGRKKIRNMADARLAASRFAASVS